MLPVMVRGCERWPHGIWETETGFLSMVFIVALFRNSKGRVVTFGGVVRIRFRGSEAPRGGLLGFTPKGGILDQDLEKSLSHALQTLIIPIIIDPGLQRRSIDRGRLPRCWRPFSAREPDILVFVVSRIRSCIHTAR